MKFFLSFLVSLITSLDLFSPSYATLFPDIKSPLLIEAATFLQEKGVIQGYPDGTFRPDQVINRAESVKIIFAAQDINPDNAPDSGFPDVPEQAWFSPFVAKALKEGIIQGYQDGLFRPHKEVSRAEFIKMAMVAQDNYIRPTTWDYENALKQFTDVDEKAWYMPSVSFALNKNLLDEGRRLRPHQGMTRADAAMIIYRIKLLQGKEEPSGSADEACPSCVEGIDIPGIDWLDHDFIKVIDGRLIIDGVDRTRTLRASNADRALAGSINRALLKRVPASEKMKVDELHPEYYKRAIALKGGSQGKGIYISTEYDKKYIRTIEGKKMGNAACTCHFEEAIIRYYNNSQTPLPPYEAWIGTEEAKSFLYDSIYMYLNTPNLSGPKFPYL